MEPRQHIPAERLDEREVHELIATCQSNSAIAVRLFYNSIFRRLDVQRAERKPRRRLGRCTSSPGARVSGC
jgi:hypothetical protein